MINEKNLNLIIGTLCIEEKYKFVPNGLIAEVLRDAVEESNKEEKEQEEEFDYTHR